MLNYKIIILFILFGFSSKINAQIGIAHEIGVVFGPVMFKSDYGARNDFGTNINNNGFGIGLVHYLNFSYNSNNSTFFSEHFKVRSEVSFSKSDFKHYGKYVEKNSNYIGVQQLKAMSGSSGIFNIGTQLEYSPIKIHDFENTIGSFGPYASIGVQLSSYTAKANSAMGQLGTPSATFPKYLDPSDGHPFGFSNESKTVFSIVSSIGTRYKLSPLQDLIIDFRFQYFNSDWVDGLNPNPEIHKENKANDWLIWVNLGYIYYLQ
ncbi:MAG TPA: glutamate dehydrogenase [Flavobacterium sp.]|uniref:THC0290_0291 family protein n=1 Tax=Flavobacterium sp. TaxID=239 RepID=UPI002BF961B2|nr:glutamate dehydrogenase [Flavobacterium sp.]HRM46732.1 glutamate dehydrogenase [Flavobacterium sp.]